MIIKDDGNVGIGTSSPGSSYKLDIRGNLRVGDGSTGERIFKFFAEAVTGRLEQTMVEMELIVITFIYDTL